MSGISMLSSVELRQLTSAVGRESNSTVTEQLLADNARKGHDKLELHRYLTLHRLDAARCAAYESYCRQIAGRLSD